MGRLGQGPPFRRVENDPMASDQPRLTFAARVLRGVHNGIGAGELASLGYLWLCALTRRRDRWLRLSVSILLGEGVALVVAKGCPLGMFQRQVGDEVPMFELWFGRRLAPFAVPFFTGVTALGLVLLLVRRPVST